MLCLWLAIAFQSGNTFTYNLQVDHSRVSGRFVFFFHFFSFFFYLFHFFILFFFFLFLATYIHWTNNNNNNNVVVCCGAILCWPMVRVTLLWVFILKPVRNLFSQLICRRKFKLNANCFDKQKHKIIVCFYIWIINNICVSFIKSILFNVLLNYIFQWFFCVMSQFSLSFTFFFTFSNISSKPK